MIHYCPWNWNKRVRTVTSVHVNNMVALIPSGEHLNVSSVKHSLLIIVITVNRFIWDKEREEKTTCQVLIFYERKDMQSFVNIHEFSLTNWDPFHFVIGLKYTLLRNILGILGPVSYWKKNVKAVWINK